MTPAPASPLERVLLALFSLAGLALCVVLVVWTDPDARGHGTHEQLGMAPCSWPDLYGEPCPTCGVTTAASLLLHFQPLAAFTTQPFGMLLTAALIAFVVTGCVYAARGRSLAARVAFWPWGWITLGACAVLLLSWAWTRSRF